MDIEKLNQQLRATCAPYRILSADCKIGGIGLGGVLGHEEITVTNSRSFSWTLGAHAPSRVEIRCSEALDLQGFLNGSSRFCAGVCMKIDGTPLDRVFGAYDVTNAVTLSPGRHVLEAAPIDGERDCHTVWGLTLASEASSAGPTYGVAISARLDGAVPPDLLDAWLDHHRGLGVDHVFLATEADPIGEGHTVNPDPGFVTMVFCHPQEAGCFHELVLRKHGHEAAWVALLETRDYLNPLGSQSLPDFLLPYQEFGGIKIETESAPDTGRGIRQIVQPPFVVEIQSSGEVITMEGRPMVGEDYSNEISSLHLHVSTFADEGVVSSGSEGGQKGGAGAWRTDAPGMRRPLPAHRIPATGRRVAGFIHVAAVNHWREILTSQLRKLRQSGLLDETTKIHVGLVGAGRTTAAEVESFSDKIEILYDDKDLGAFEFPTLIALQNFCDGFEGDVWYLHTKGSVNLRDNQHSWRSRMEDFVIFKHRLARAKLEQGYVAAGGFANPDPRWHVPGNFWWARSDYVRGLPRLADFDLQNRYEAERWIACTGPEDIYFHDSGDSNFREFRIISSKVAAGFITTNGFHGWMRSRVTVDPAWSYDVLLSAHAPCEIILEVRHPVSIFGFMAGTSERGSWTVQFEKNGEDVGALRSPCSRTQEFNLAPGTHRLRCHVTEGAHWGAHSCWAIATTRKELDDPVAASPIAEESVGSSGKRYWDHRTTILNDLIETAGYASYLEIGLGDGLNFARIKCGSKCSVDPVTGRYPIATPSVSSSSDEFFRTNRSTYDLIFIDGLHEAEQVEKDINNSLRCLNKGGMIVCHDMNPQSEAMQRVPRSQTEWTGDCWKAWVRIRARFPDVSAIVVDADYGVGILIPDGPRTPTLAHPSDSALEWPYFQENREKLLNLMSPGKARDFVRQAMPLMA
ncbi:class I SAM-dependent methyltransferase [Luteolibacter sp. GHJ8]|uniref:Class I SAM-dependent methyltransferase n=1 Tax=Luteolibacter rhizosphaerae TaxID=2989719 RepID=A0ABT3FZ92_9BACT|nr:class I SAM-dependent methyltransferase [Luteolibacter rhizosphaerae]MCW1912908.1 class I SAM-dependent methyltransferase [Luteolibacter rhizosphaerae]